MIDNNEMTNSFLNNTQYLQNSNKIITIYNLQQNLTIMYKYTEEPGIC